MRDIVCEDNNEDIGFVLWYVNAPEKLHGNAFCSVLQDAKLKDLILCMRDKEKIFYMRYKYNLIFMHWLASW